MNQVRNIEYFKPDEKSPEIKYLKERRLNLGGYLLKEQRMQNQLRRHQKIFLIS